jgi:type I restriction enzyme M protein
MILGFGGVVAVKKSEIYNRIWQGCDVLRGGMDPSQYKDYVLSILFIKYVSDKYAGQTYGAIKVPEGCSFKDMIQLKGKPDIGDQINKKIIAPLANANKLSGFPDFNDAGRFGSGKQMIDTLTGLIATFEHPDLDFSRNRADGDDILGDAYEFLMRHFATESGKSKGQFYTPAEVSRIIAQLIGIRDPKTTNQTTVYDPTCGSGSLLIKVADEAGTKVTLYGQEKDGSTAGLALMNLILHDYAGAVIHPGQSTLADPFFRDGSGLKAFDYVVANPPFSDKRWSQGVDPNELKPGLTIGAESPDTVNFHRFDGFGLPPPKQGDFAYLLHIIKSLKSTGKAACILPHGVLFRGNAEAEIRKNLIRRGYIKAIIGLPPNLFYGTGIPACIIVIDKANAAARRGIFMIDASRGFMRDGPKNRLREMDTHRIVDVFRRGQDVPKYARMVSYDQIEKNDFNLNLPRYIDSQPPEDRHDIEGHLKGGIPVRDVEALGDYWAICPGLKAAIFKPGRTGYVDLAVAPATIRAAIHDHSEFRAFTAGLAQHFEAWREGATARLKDLSLGFHPKELIGEVSEGLLKHYGNRPLIDAYAVYQHLMGYWAEVMQDDAYMIAQDGWTAKTTRIIETKKGKDGKEKTSDKGWTCDLVPKEVLVARYFAKEAAAMVDAEAERERMAAQMLAMEEEHGNEDGLFSELIEDGEVVITEKAAKARLKEIKGDRTTMDEAKALGDWLKLAEREKDLKRTIKAAEAALDEVAEKRYPKLTEDDVKALVVDDKWMTALEARIAGETARVAQALTRRVKELGERYTAPLPELSARVGELEGKVAAHLERMGFRP